MNMIQCRCLDLNKNKGKAHDPAQLFLKNAATGVATKPKIGWERKNAS